MCYITALLLKNYLTCIPTCSRTLLYCKGKMYIDLGQIVNQHIFRGRRGCDRVVVGFTTTYASIAYYH